MNEKVTNAKVDTFINNLEQWQDEFKFLRKLSLDTELEEEFKWKHPCYTLNDKNVVIIQDFKHYCALLFEKGAIMEDKYDTLVQQTKNVQAARQLRFKDLAEIQARETEIAWYLEEAIRVEKSGKQVKMKNTDEYEMPEELRQALDNDETLQTAFNNLTPGRQRQYMYYIGQAKRSETRTQRIEKYKNQILAGKGMNDK